MRPKLDQLHIRSKVRSLPGGISNFHNVFAVWHKLEGDYNPDDGGWPAFIGINKRYNQKFFDANHSLLLKWRENMHILVPKARIYLQVNYWDPIKAKTPEEKVLKYFYQSAWRCPYTMKRSPLEISVQCYMAKHEFAAACATPHISYKGVLRRVEIFNADFGPVVPL